MIKKSVCLFLLLLFMSGVVSAALGIAPAVKKYNFAPGKVIEINFDVISDDPNQLIEIYASDDLAEFVTLSRKEIVGPGRFTAVISLPQVLAKPGKNILGIGVREVPSESSFFGTKIDVRASIVIFAPYPGRYIETELSVSDGNVDEEIPIQVYVINRGKEDLNINVYIDFFDSNGDKISTMTFQSVTMETNNERFFRKFLNTTGYKPGDYVAEAVINYGEEIRINETFRIGSLFVNITNFTENLLQEEGFQEFSVGIESKWNGDLKEVFADVNISNDFGSVIFRTPSTDLKAWTAGELVGFVDTSDMEGEYNVEIVLSYADQQTIAHGTLVVSKFSKVFIIGIAVGIVIIILITILVVWFIRRKGYRKKK